MHFVRDGKHRNTSSQHKARLKNSWKAPPTPSCYAMQTLSLLWGNVTELRSLIKQGWRYQPEPRTSSKATWPSTRQKHEIVTSESCRALLLDHEEVGGSPGNQNRFDFLQWNHPHSLSGWHVIFYNESKVWFNLKGKETEKKKKNRTKQNNCNSLLATEPHMQGLVPSKKTEFPSENFCS